MGKRLALLLMLSCPRVLSADTYNNLSIQGQASTSTVIQNVDVQIWADGYEVGEASPIDIVPDTTTLVFSTQTYIANPWIFRAGSNYELKLVGPEGVMSTSTLTAVPFAQTVRGNANTGDQNIFASYGNVGIGTTSPDHRLVVSSAGATLMWVSTDGVHAPKFTGDGSALTGILGTGDSLGTHIATQTLNMDGNKITGVGDISAARYQISGSTVLAVLPGFGSLGVGVGAGRINSGSGNTFVGDSSGYYNTNAGFNTFIGDGAGYYSIGGNNTFVGGDAGEMNGAGSGNVYIGDNSGSWNAGNSNAFVGSMSGAYTETGYENTFVGAGAGYGNTTGDQNVLLGFMAGGDNLTGSNNIVVGHNQNTSVNSASNELNIGGVLFGNIAAKTIGVSTRVPQAALDVVSTRTAANVYAQIWRNGSGMVVASMTSEGSLYTAQPIAGDNLGNHIATHAVDMAGYQIFNVSSITVIGKDASGYSLSLSSGISMPAGTVVADRFVGNGSGLTGLPSSGDVYKASTQTFTGQNTLSANTYFPASGIWNTSGNVGIGTTTPNAPLHVLGGMIIGIGDHPGFKTSSLNMDFSSTFSAGRIQAGTTGASPLLLQPSGGNVGIGTTNPTRKLEVVGSDPAAVNVKVHGSYETFKTGTGYPGDWVFGAGGAVGNANDFSLYDGVAGGAGVAVIVKQQTGNVGIGTTNPGTKLAVTGGDVAITTQGNGLILRDTNGTGCHRITVNSGGTLSATAVTCP